jgi:hypothetical protein
MSTREKIAVSFGVVELPEIESPFGRALQNGQRVKILNSGDLYQLRQVVSSSDTILTVKKDLLSSGSINSGNIDVITDAVYNVTLTDDFIRCDCSLNSITLNLPTATNTRRLTYVIKKIDSTGNTVSIETNGSETIDNSDNVLMTQQFTALKITSNGSNWDIIT